MRDNGWKGMHLESSGSNVISGNTANNNGGITYFDLCMISKGCKWTVNCSDTGGHIVFPSNASKGYSDFSVG